MSNTYVYVVDANDHIVQIGDAEAWDTFARENAAESLQASAVSTRSLWQFIKGLDAQAAYRVLMAKVRGSGGALMFPFRCDSPTHRRYMDMTIDPAQNRALRFQSRIVREEPRDVRMEVLDVMVPRSARTLHLCSMCKKAKIDEKTWFEIEDAVEYFGLFDSTSFPQLVNCLCESCLGMLRDRCGLMRDEMATIRASM